MASSLDLTELKKAIISALTEKQLLVTREIFSTIKDCEDPILLGTLLARAKNMPTHELDSYLKEFVLKSIKEGTTTPADSVLGGKPGDRGSSITTSAGNVEVLFAYKDFFKKREVDDFVQHYHHRYNTIERILRRRQDMQNLLSINRILTKTEKESVSFIGLVLDKQESKKGAIILTLEDTTGQMKAIATSRNEEVLKMAQDIVLDEVIGIRGMVMDHTVFIQQIFLPDVPLANQMSRSPNDCYAAVISDLHVGSNQFLEEKFLKFLSWIEGDSGNHEQKEIVKKIRYLFVVGDLVDGVGIFPGQQNELVIPDVKDQYAACARYLSRVPKHIKMIICPGNHDAMRLAEPQPVFYPEFAGPLLDLPNATFVTNPSFVRIERGFIDGDSDGDGEGESGGFGKAAAGKELSSGISVPMYHGYSFDHYIANVDTLRTQGGYDRADLMMKFLLQRRHLAPTHASTQYIPDTRADYHVIDQVPDIFLTGHLHKTAVANYRGITMICGSCWQGMTSFQKRVGHHPEPARVPLINLKTREVKILKF